MANVTLQDTLTFGTPTPEEKNEYGNKVRTHQTNNAAIEQNKRKNCGNSTIIKLNREAKKEPKVKH